MPLDPGVQSLSGTRAFTNVLESGRRRNQGPVTVIAKPNSRDHSRLGLVAGRRLGGAVVRNRARRRLRHALHAAKIPTGFDVVVIARQGTLTVAFHNLEDNLRKAVSSATRGEQDE